MFQQQMNQSMTCEAETRKVLCRVVRFVFIDMVQMHRATLVSHAANLARFSVTFPRINSRLSIVILQRLTSFRSGWNALMSRATFVQLFRAFAFFESCASGSVGNAMRFAKDRFAVSGLLTHRASPGSSSLQAFDHHVFAHVAATIRAVAISICRWLWAANTLTTRTSDGGGDCVLVDMQSFGGLARVVRACVTPKNGRLIGWRASRHLGSLDHGVYVDMTQGVY